MSGLIWIQTVLHSDSVPERFFLKKSADNKKKHEKYTAPKGLSTYHIMFYVSDVLGSYDTFTTIRVFFGPLLGPCSGPNQRRYSQQPGWVSC